MKQHTQQKENNFNTCLLAPGYLAVSHEPTVIFSVCGNGVVIVVWDRIKHCGGMAYCISPKKKWKESPSNYFADSAVKTLIGSMLITLRSHRSNINAQLFGGGHLKGFGRKRALETLKVCRKTLKKLNIKIVSEDVGGIMGRKIFFNTFSGEVGILKTPNIRKTDWDPYVTAA